MKRYGNFFDDDDIMTPSKFNYLGNLIFQNSNHDISYPLRDRALVLFQEASDRSQSQHLEKISVSNGFCIDIYVFDYNSTIYYWWDLYKGDKIIKSALEFRIRSSHYGDSFVTHVWWATDPNQTPLIWTNTLKNYIKDKYK